ncbi:hypothetical protein [Pseudorhodoferax sp. Leaf267]|uniref:hypothetical protein n=1 Tax=Pseudorhodoferax sp. Leaf267 TaxID=1736316 RepID=UPI0006F4FF59|nr:hypothetical protein [Pseudorhodoferax sp. Leaf267]KQP22714.1 hypothetical protein ASF43_02050 [Pseudorhodoferax sp. Leaf267]
MRPISPAHWLAALASLVALAAVAQPAPPAPPAAPPAVPAYRSAFEGYRPMADDKPIPWRQANETVRQRGGWKAYAQEAEAPAAEGPHKGHAMPPAKARP